MKHLTPMQVAFGARLESLRRYYGRRTGRPRLNMTAMAEEVGVEAARYRRWERGEMEPPLFALAKLRKLTGLSLDWLVADMPPGEVALPEMPPATPGDRLRWAREVRNVEVAQIAQALLVPIPLWVAYEDGREIPLEIARDFARRFSVSLDYIYVGALEGVHPQMRDLLLAKRPQLAEQSPGRYRSDASAGTARDMLNSPRDEGTQPIELTLPPPLQTS